MDGGDKVNAVAGGYRVPKRDLVLAVALACWWVRRRQSQMVRVMRKPPGF
jgi:hypothetical protein